jgi:signal transduction histidine kinase
MGIHGMRERIELLNGIFEIGSGPSGGTLVSALLPR